MSQSVSINSGLYLPIPSHWSRSGILWYFHRPPHRLHHHHHHHRHRHIGSCRYRWDRYYPRENLCPWKQWNFNLQSGKCPEYSVDSASMRTVRDLSGSGSPELKHTHRSELSQWPKQSDGESSMLRGRNNQAPSKGAKAVGRMTPWAEFHKGWNMSTIQESCHRRAPLRFDSFRNERLNY